MKQHDLENFISDNKDEFDDKSPSNKVWNNIRFRMGFNNSGSSIWWKAAAVIFFALSVFLYVDRDNTKISGEPISKTGDFNEVETYYLNVIDEKKELITGLSEKTVLGEKAERDLQRLDAMYDVLKEEYRQNPSKKVIDAIILNMLVRIDILNDEIQNVEDNPAETEVAI